VGKGVHKPYYKVSIYLVNIAYRSFIDIGASGLFYMLIRRYRV